MITFAVWVVVLLGAAALLGLLTRGVARKGFALVRELGDVSADLAAVSELARSTAEQQRDASQAAAGTDHDQAPLTTSAGHR